jgi:oligopeptide/dipeptide ABC transporter ATP-binding protein
LLRVEDIAVTDYRTGRPLPLSGPVSFTISPGEIFGIVGESGSGKSMTALALMRLAPPSTRITGAAWLHQRNLCTVTEAQMRTLRGAEMAMIFQEPVSALNPVFTIEAQLVAAIRAHHKLTPGQARSRAIELLRQVGIPDPQRRLKAYPHQLSGGMCQRLMIAMALAAGAKLLIADEPTTALDVTIQDQVINLIARLARENNLSVIFISHDLGLVANFCDRVAVMYCGEIVELGTAAELLNRPQHPYTKGLVRCVPTLSKIGVVQRGIAGTPPLAGAWPSGCRFRERCTFARDQCHAPQALATRDDGRAVRCCRAGELGEVA